MNTLNQLSQADCDRIPAAHDEAGFGALHSSAGNLPLRAMAVDVQITGLVSRVEVRQTFVNTHDAPLEATYIFPLPSRSAVTDFELKIGDRTVIGKLKERGEARAEYSQAIKAGKRAAIAEEERPDVFTMRVGNIMPGETADVVLTFCGPLGLVDSEACFRFPLVVAPRYIPGSPLSGSSVGDGISVDTDAVPDASRITPPVLLPGFPNPVALTLRVELDPAGLPFGEPRSSLHTVVEDDSVTGRRVLNLQPGERLNRDFILRFGVDTTEIGSSLVLKPDADSADGTFLLTLTPPAAASAACTPRDVVFLLDRSGSMNGWKMVAARRALARMIDTLTDQDRVNVLAFDSQVETPHDGLQAATDRRRYQTIEFLAKVGARGGTEMLRPVQQALDLLHSARSGNGDRQRVLVLVTDGQVANEDEILRNAKLKDVSVFTLGIDRAVNEGFLRRFAELGGGEFELVETEDRLDEVMDRIHRRIGQPVLTDLCVRADGMEIDLDSIVPQRLPDLFAGCPLLLYGRYSAAGECPAVQVSATATDGGAYAVQVEGRAVDSTAVRSIWARGQIRALEDQYTIANLKDNRSSLTQRIVATSLRFGVLSRFTAFVAVDSEVINEGGDVHGVVQSVELPDGWELETRSSSPMAGGAMGGGIVADCLGEDFEKMTAREGPVRAARPASAMIDGLANFASGLANKMRRKKSSRDRTEPNEDLDLREAVVKLRRELRGDTSFTRPVVVLELLRRLLAADLSAELRAELVEVQRELEAASRGVKISAPIARRLDKLFDRLLAERPARDEFWK